ncbi:MAG: saccharopine dehydrogenase C-terminal domain-containing protein [Gemmatimonadales bacterium]
MRRALVMGAGLVVKPLIDHLTAREDLEVRVATMNVERAERLLAGRPRTSAGLVNATDQESLLHEVGGADVVISLLPANQHILLADACLQLQTPLVTTSYVSESLRALDPLARQRGVLILGECGLDPGIDHMTAAAEVRRIHGEGGRVTSFASSCGGLPAPEANTNPWGYKFAWSPRGVVVATRNQVRYLDEGRIVSQRFPEYFASPRTIEVPEVGVLESYPNRDCLRYIEEYELEGVSTFFRGTLRYPGWCETWHALHSLGLLEPGAVVAPRSGFGGFLDAQLGPGSGARRERIAARLGLPASHPILERIEWLGLLADDPVTEAGAPMLDLLVALLERKLAYAPGERDMVVLEHHLGYEDDDGQPRRRVLRLVETATAGDDSAMARTVSLPAAIAGEMILDGKVDLTGVRIPTHPELARPILRRLERAGLAFRLSEER